MTRLAAAILAGALLAGVGCGSDDEDAYSVLAAASLTEAFELISEDVCCAELSFGPSSAIVRQVLEGAPADVVATADARTMDAIVDAGVVDGTTIAIATNSVVLVAPRNEGVVSGLADITGDVTLAVCAPDVPCGRGADRWLERFDGAVEPTTFESDVKAVLTKVELGEVDAGIVYRTDARTAEDTVRVVDDAPDISTTYFVALLEGASGPARDFVDAVRGSAGRRVLRQLGFGPA